MKRIIIALVLIILNMAGMTPSCLGGLPIGVALALIYFGVVSFLKKQGY
jgi:hypothetical protein